MGTYKIIIERVITNEGYVEADSAQAAVNQIYYPVEKDSDDNIIRKHPPGFHGWEASERGVTDTIKSLIDVSGGDAAVSPIPTPVES